MRAAGRPDGKGKATDQVIEARLSPAEPCGEQDLRVGELSGVGKVQLAGEIGAIVQTNIGHQTAGAICTPKWLVVEAIFRQEREKAAAKGDQTWIRIRGGRPLPEKRSC